MTNHLLHPQGQPSHINISRGLASLGRAGDSQLVHMSANEVQGLQKLAMATGGSLTRNPQTGLLEASWLENILPLVAGAALSFTGVGAPAAALMVGAADTAINKGNWKEGLAAGLGAFGGAGLAAGLAGAGAGAAGTAAAGTDASGIAGAAGTPAVVDAAGNVAGTALDTSAAGNVAGGALQSAGINSIAPVANDVAAPVATDITPATAQAASDLSPVVPTAQTITPPTLNSAAQGYYNSDQLAANSYGQNASNAYQGIKDIGTNPAGVGSSVYSSTGKIGLAGLAAPAAYQAYQNAQNNLNTPAKPFNYYTTTYNQGKANPNYGLAGQSPLSGQGYGPSVQQTYTPITYKKGGRIKHFDTGGAMPMGPPPPRPPMGGGQAQLTGASGTGLAALPNPPSAQGPQQGIAAPTPLPPLNPMQAPPSASAQNAYLANLQGQVTGKIPAPTQPKTPPAKASTTPNGAGMVFNPKTGTYTLPTPGVYTTANDDLIFGSSSDPQYTDMGTGVTTTGGFDFAGGTPYASGGMTQGLGSFSDGGQMLKGPGDGMSDDIPAHINGAQPAALADSEFVVPSDVVSHLGNGSSSAGAKKLYAMMDRVRQARTGRKAQGKQINADKFLPG